MATLKDLSAHLGLSVTQVSRALNGYSDVSEATRARVEEAARLLKYQPNLSARKLARGRSGLVAVVRRHFDEMTKDQTFLNAVTGLSHEFSKRDMQLVLHIAPREKDAVELHRQLYGGGALDGFVILEPHENDARIAYLQEANVPFVVHGRSEIEADYAFFDIDNVAVGYELTKYLINLGHRKILLLNGFSDRGYNIHREIGYKQALEEAGIPFDPSLVINDRMTEQYGIDAINTQIINNPEPPSAVVCGHIRIATGVYQALDAAGIRIPEDVSVVAHDDLIIDMKADGFVPSLTVSRAAIQDSWIPLSDFMDRAIRGEDPKTLQEVEPIEVIDGASTAKL